MKKKIIVTPDGRVFKGKQVGTSTNQKPHSYRIEPKIIKNFKSEYGKNASTRIDYLTPIMEIMDEIDLSCSLSPLVAGHTMDELIYTLYTDNWFVPFEFEGPVFMSLGTSEDVKGMAFSIKEGGGSFTDHLARAMHNALIMDFDLKNFEYSEDIRLAPTIFVKNRNGCVGLDKKKYSTLLEEFSIIMPKEPTINFATARRLFSLIRNYVSFHKYSITKISDNDQYLMGSYILENAFQKMLIYGKDWLKAGYDDADFKKFIGSLRIRKITRNDLQRLLDKGIYKNRPHCYRDLVSIKDTSIFKNIRISNIYLIITNPFPLSDDKYTLSDIRQMLKTPDKSSKVRGVEYAVDYKTI